MKRLAIKEEMARSGVRFGTSGARGLVSSMTDELCVTYALAFLQHLSDSDQLREGSSLCLGGDRRPSTPRILRALGAAAKHYGIAVDDQGLLPSPALVLHGMKKANPTIMVTGSHIPEDRNGLKFTTAKGEIDKDDEKGMLAQIVELPDWFDEDGSLTEELEAPKTNSKATESYEERFTEAFPSGCLKGMRLGVFGHSAVGRELMVRLYERMGAEIIQLGFSESFVPVDTEAIRAEDVRSAKKWAKDERLDAIVSTDGDSDRPLLADEKGTWFRGDIAGIHTARFLRADAVSTAVSCNTALELSGFFPRVERTRIGSPYVIEGMEKLQKKGASGVVGYEANGGFLQLSPLAVRDGGELSPLPTRDPTIVHLALLLSAREAGVPLSRLNEALPQRVTASGRDQKFATERSMQLLQKLRAADSEKLAELIGLGTIDKVDNKDGLRLSLRTGEVLHLRPSGNAPELRCYAEAESDADANRLVEYGLSRAARLTP